MKIKMILGSLQDQKLPLLVVNLFEGVKSPSGATGKIDHCTGGLISELIKDGEITGRKNEMTLIHTLGHSFKNFLPNRVLIIGLGSIDDFNYNRILFKSTDLGGLTVMLFLSPMSTVIADPSSLEGS